MSESLRNSGVSQALFAKILLLFSFVLFLTGSPLQAQYRELSVIGFSEDGKMAAVRNAFTGEQSEVGDEERGYSLDIQVWMMAKKKMGKSFPVISQQDTELIRAGMKDKAVEIAKYPRMRRLRARRWKKVSRSLRIIGFNIVKLPTPIKPAGKGGNKRFALENNGLVLGFKVYPKPVKRNVKKGIGGSFPRVDLMLEQGGKTIALRRKFYREEKRGLGFAFMQLEAMFPRQYIKALYLSPDRNYLILIDRGKVTIYDLKAQLKKLAGK